MANLPLKLFLSAVIVITAGCRLEVIVPEGGRVTSASGSFDCDMATTCQSDITDYNFEEAFTAIPNTGFRFAGWSKTESNVCEGIEGTCELSLRTLPTSLRNRIFNSDSVARLAPIFEATDIPQEVSVSGGLTVLEVATLDFDTNNTENFFASNNTFQLAQTLLNPGAVGGYINLPGEGASGKTQDAGDFDDYFIVEAEAGDVVTLFASDYLNSDLDLYLYDRNGEPVDSSLGTGEVEQLTIPEAGTWYVNATVFSGAANYVLTVGRNNGTASSQKTKPQVIPGEALVTWEGEGIFKRDIIEDRQHHLKHKFALLETGGGLGRARRFNMQPATPSSLGINDSSHLISRQAELSHDPYRLAQWQTRILAKRLTKEPGVALAEPNWKVQTKATTDDSFIRFMWHLDQIGVPAAWDTTTGDPGVVVAVIDTGIISDHPDIRGQLIDGYDFISDATSAGDGDGIDPDPTDIGEGSNPLRSGDFHGLHVTGTIGATGNNNRGIAGVAYSSRIMPLRALGADGSGSTYDILQAVRYAAGFSNDANTLPSNPAAVINLSIGGAGFSQTAQNLYTAVAKSGILIAAASGNDGSSNVDYPGGYADIFAVGATDAVNGISDYSNRGPALDLVAPGGRLGADANGDGQPDGIISTYYSDGLPEYVFLQGTSMATPHVAGVFALMKSVNPNLDASTVEDLLQLGLLTDDLGDTGRDNTFGWGMINARKAVTAAISYAGGEIDIPPRLGVSTSLLNFGSSLNTADLVVTNQGGGEVSVVNVEKTADWLSISEGNTDAAGLGTWRFSVDRQELKEGPYRTDVTFQSTAGDVSVSVEIRVSNNAAGGIGNIGVVYVLFINTETQEIWQGTTAAASDLSYIDDEYAITTNYLLGPDSREVDRLPVGIYEIWAGTDNDNDLFICDAGETCGAWPSIDTPAVITISEDRNDIIFPSDYQISLPSISSTTLKPMTNSRFKKSRKHR
ncbi:MAG: S8 family serine peptidase [Halieaceae bacterium]|mgnify:CR=1 FL=1|jgi:serine protease|nr:S8 family serine peptidase [Halieaceae bacterium]